MNEQAIPTIDFGATGRTVTRVGLGGEGVLRTHGREEEARAVIRAALGAGIGYFDSARAYAGSERYLGGVWGEEPAARARVFQTSKSAARGRDGALADLETSLTNLATDHLDLWQIHDVRTWDDVRAIESADGALAAFTQARASGTARAVGVTGHHDPAVLTHCVRNWPVDSVLLPVNPAEGVIGGFLSETLPAARERGVAVIGMKVLGGAHYVRPESGLTPELLLAYAFSWPVTLIIVGCSTPDHVQTLAAAAAAPPMPPELRAEVEAAFAPVAGQLAFYRGVL